MGTIVIDTDSFLDVTGTLSATSGGSRGEVGHDGLFLYTQKGSYGDEPGEVDLLCGLSTDGQTASHYYGPYDGTGKMDPTFWPNSAVGLVVGAFASRAASSESHAIRIEQLEGDKVRVTEYSNPEDGVKVEFNVLPAKTFPADGVRRWINGEMQSTAAVGLDEIEIDDGNTAVWDWSSLGGLLRLSKSWKTQMKLHKRRSGRSHLVEMVGFHSWIGVAIPPTPVEASHVNDGITVEAHMGFPSINTES